MLESTMQDAPLSITSILRHGQRIFADSQVVTFEGDRSRRASFAEVSARSEKLAIDLAAFDEAVKAATKKARGLTAPHTAAEAVRNAITMEFDAALDRERELFLERRDSEESAAQRHLFFATREAGGEDGC